VFGNSVPCTHEQQIFSLDIRSAENSRIYPQCVVTLRTTAVMCIKFSCYIQIKQILLFLLTT